MGNKIVFYSTHCPRCKVLETKIKQKHIAYDECNDIQIMKEKGFEMAPQLEVDGIIMDFKAALKWIGEQ